MNTLADSFLEDLEELGESSEEELEVIEEVGETKGENDTGDNDIDAAERVLEKVKAKEANRINLRQSDRYQEHMKEIDRLLLKGSHERSPKEEYPLVVASNDLMVEMDDELLAIHKAVVEGYSKKFPELESLVPNALDYVRVVKEIANETDMTSVNLSSILPSATVMGVSVTGSTTSGTLLTSEELKAVLESCDEVLALDNEKQKILKFVEDRMNLMAPNTSAILGTRITAQLVGLAGGLASLSRTPSCNVQVMGQKKRVLSGFSNAAAMKNIGIIYFSELIQNTPQYLRQKACRAVAGKVILAARVDDQLSARAAAEGTNPAALGQKLFRDLELKIEKMQEAPKAKTKKALKLPDEKPRRKRGGKRYRKMKERMQMTDVRKEANRQSFATADNDEYGDNAMGISHGRLGQEGSGNLRVIRKEQKQLTKKLKSASYASGSTSGLASSLAFTPVQGLELMNPEAAQEKVRQANKKWFADTGFSNLKKSE